MDGLPLSFERNLYQAVIRFKQLHPGELEARTRRRRERENGIAGSAVRPDRSEVREADGR